MKEEFTTNTRRWYDKDPVLSSAMKTLEESDDETQIKVALNLIKIITEHHLSSTEYESVEDIVSATEDVMDESKHGRWYDLDGTLRTAISLLQNCPDSTRSVIAKEMAKNVIDIIKKARLILNSYLGNIIFTNLSPILKYPFSSPDKSIFGAVLGFKGKFFFTFWILTGGIFIDIFSIIY